MRKPLLLIAILLIHSLLFAQRITRTQLAFVKDSTIKARMHQDSLAVEKEFARQEKIAGMFERAEYPLIKSADWGAIFPVKDPTEIPDPNQDYKLLFEIAIGNNDSARDKIDENLAEVARVINLHIASGIPTKRIIPVIVVHGTSLNAFITNESFRKKYKIDNPNLQILDEFRAIGARFIACGQAMQFFDVARETLMPDVKVSLTAQTVLSNYRLKGYVLYKIEPM